MQEQYERYVGNILAEGDKVAIKFTGLTWPGCGCKTCSRRYAELRAGGHNRPNPALWQGLNPAKDVGGWAFTTVVERIPKHLGDRVAWMRPSDITNQYHQSGRWDFIESL